MLFFAGLVFFGTFVAIASEKVHKTAAALVGAALMLLFVLPGPRADRETPPPSLGEALTITARTSTAGAVDARYENLDVYARYVNFDVFFTLVGMMILVGILSGTGFFQYMAIKAAKIGRGRPIVTLTLLCVSTALLSAFLDNVTTVLLVAPISLVVASTLGVPPMPFLMAETICSNIGGAATLIGDPPNLIIGSAAGLSFSAFLINLAPFVLVLLALYCLALAGHYHPRMSVTVERRARVMEMDERAAIVNPTALRRAGVVMGLTIVGFLVHGAMGIQPCVIAMSGAALALAVCRSDVDRVIEKIEWGTLFFFLGLFVLVEGANHAGLMGKIGDLLRITESWNPLLAILAVMWFCGLSVAVMNNVSFTAVMVSILGAFMSAAPAFRDNPALRELMWWGVALAVCLGGNCTLLGAAANLVAVGISEQAGHRVSFREFLRYGAPISVFSLLLSSAYIAVRYCFVA